MHLNIKVTESGESVRECVLAAKNKESESEREDKRGSNQSDKVISLHLLLSLSLLLFWFNYSKWIRSVLQLPNASQR